MQNIVLPAPLRSGWDQAGKVSERRCYGKQTLIDDLIRQRMQPAGLRLRIIGSGVANCSKKRSGLLRGGNSLAGFPAKNDKASNARVAGKHLRRIRRQHNGPQCRQPSSLTNPSATSEQAGYSPLPLCHARRASCLLVNKGHPNNGLHVARGDLAAGSHRLR